MKIFFILVILYSIGFAQNTDALKFFPYKTGDMWEYFWYDTQYPDTLQNFNIKDSIDAEGNIYLWQSARFINPISPPALLGDTSVYKIDSSFNVFCLTNPIENQFLYKLNAQKDEQWVVHIYQDSSSIYGYEMARVRKVWNDELFGKQTTFKNYMYYYAPDSTDTLGLVRYSSTLAYNFGLYYKGSGDAVGDIYLKGCVISDTLYGDTTKIITSVKDLSENPQQFKLYNNYPNPFNPLTTITFTLNNSEVVSLIIYNLTGQEVRRLINNDYYYSGNHKIIWDSKNDSNHLVSSGVYIYTLQVNGFTSSKKMLLMK